MATKIHDSDYFKNLTKKRKLDRKPIENTVYARVDKVEALLKKGYTINKNGAEGLDVVLLNLPAKKTVVEKVIDKLKKNN